MVKDNDLRKSVWTRYVDYSQLFENPCFVCRTEIITPFNFELCHVVAESKGGPLTLENLRPGCATCNRVCQVKDLLQFRRERYPLQVCFFESCVNEAICGWFCEDHVEQLKPKVEIMRDQLAEKSRKSRKHLVQIKQVERPLPVKSQTPVTFSKDSFSIPLPSRNQDWAEADYRKLQEQICPFYKKRYTYLDVIKQLSDKDYHIYLVKGQLNFRKHQLKANPHFIFFRELSKHTVYDLKKFCGSEGIESTSKKPALLASTQEYLDKYCEVVEETDDLILYKRKLKNQRISLNTYYDVFPDSDTVYYFDPESKGLFCEVDGEIFCSGSLINDQYQEEPPEFYASFKRKIPDVVGKPDLRHKLMLVFRV